MVQEVILIEDGCCHAGELDGYVGALRGRLQGVATVKLLSIGGHLGFAAISPELGRRLGEQGANSLPQLVLDGELLHQGSLPGWEAAAREIEERLATGPAPGKGT